MLTTEVNLPPVQAPYPMSSSSWLSASDWISSSLTPIMLQSLEVLKKDTILTVFTVHEKLLSLLAQLFLLAINCSLQSGSLLFI